MVLFECTNDALTIIDAVKRVLNIVQIALIVLLIVYCTLDIAKIVISKNDDEIKKYRSSIYNRIISCILIFLIPSIVFLIFGSILNNSSMSINEIKQCWYKDRT